MNRYKYLDEKKQHLHTLDGKPLIGNTTALKVIGKELTWWASGMALKGFGWKPLNKDDEGNPLESKDDRAKRSSECLSYASECFKKVKSLTDKEYFDLLGTSYKAHNEKKKSAGTEGTDAHELCELWIKSVISENPIIPDAQILPFVEWCNKNVKRFLWSEIYLYSERSWTGGICDLGYEDMGGRYVLADFKNREKTYPTDILQCGGYDLMLTENKAGFDKDGNKIFDLLKPISLHAVFPLKDMKNVVISDALLRNRNGFEQALALHKTMQTFERF